MTTSEKKLTRRSFLATTALTAGAMATASLAGCSSVSTDEKPELSETGEPAPLVEEQTYINTCRGNCGGNCVLKGTVREGKIVSVKPQELPSEAEGLTQGCVKGMASMARIYGTHRVTHPLKQTGERGSDQWEQISWDEAIQLVADKFTAAMDEYGPKSIALWHGAGTTKCWLGATPYVIANWLPDINLGVGYSRFLKKTGATYFGNGGDQAGMYMRFFVLGVPNGTAEDLQYAKTVVVWGSNPMEANIGRNAGYWLMRGKENGARIITIDPLRTATAAHSDKWIPVRVGTDAALMCALCNYLIENNMADVDYLKNKSVAPLLTKADGSYARLSDLGQAEASAEDDMPLVWDEAAKDFVACTQAADPALSGPRDLNGEALATVYDLTMESIKPFTVEFAANECGISEEAIIELAQDIVADKATTFCIDWGIEHTANAFRLYYCSAFLASVCGCVGVPGGGYCAPNGNGSSFIQRPISTNAAAVDMADAAETQVITGDWIPEIVSTGKWAGQDYPLRALMIVGHNPMDNGNDPLGMVEAWRGIDFVCTVEQFMTTTAHYCDLVLPVTMSWEQEDFDGNFMCQKAIEPAGECLTDFEIIRRIATAMGYEDLYDKTEEEYLREYLDTPENLEAGLGYDAWHERGVIMKDYEYGESSAAEYNPMGRTQFYVEQFMYRDQQGLEVPPEDRLPLYTKAAEAYHDNPDREKYPLFGFSNHEVYHGQTLHAHNKWLDAFRTYEGSPFCRIHPEAAKARGIKTGDTVRCFNDHGHVVLKAVVTPGVQKESVWFPHGFFWDEFEDGFAQSLTGHCPDVQTCNANFNDFICEVEKYEGGAQ